MNPGEPEKRLLYNNKDICELNAKLQNTEEPDKPLQMYHLRWLLRIFFKAIIWFSELIERGELCEKIFFCLIAISDLLQSVFSDGGGMCCVIM